MRLRALPLLLWLLATPLASASAPPGVRVSWTPERIVLGEAPQVSLEVHVPEGAGALHAAVSTGTLVHDRLEGGPVRTFQWRPPSVRYPQVAVFLFWLDGAGPDADAPRVTVARLPLHGQTELEVATAPGAQVEVEVADRRFGPVLANAQGKARVPVEVPPGVQRARVLATRGTLRTDATVPLDAPPDSPLVAVLMTRPLPADEGGLLLVAGTEPLRPGDVEPRATGAMVEPALEQSSPAAANLQPQDVLRFRVMPRPGATTVQVRVRRHGQPHEALVEAGVVARGASVGAARGAPEEPSWQASYFLLAGGVLAGGSNTGPAGSVGVTVVTPLWQQRLAAELEVGARSATHDGPVDSFGTVHSQVVALPVLLSLRAELVHHKAFTVYGRAGGGPLPVHHYLSSDFQEEVKESRIKGMAFLSVQAAHRFGRWSALAEARAAWAPVHTPWLDTQLGGLALYLGMRFEP
ncbi:hypothetical protein [Myxococcus sp. Y35]|uniref:hypothetical protein n=1 Tax=Pseudomyxococcus flavus TaxID=3115648 RepID=UPI003CF81314